MHKILLDLLLKFGIEESAIGWDELDNTEGLDEYIVYSFYDDEDSNITTEGNLSETYFITVTYWYKNLDNINKYRKIKSLLKEHGFIYDGGSNLKGDNVRGKSMDFIYTLNILE